MRCQVKLPKITGLRLKARATITLSCSSVSRAVVAGRRTAPNSQRTRASVPMQTLLPPSLQATGIRALLTRPQVQAAAGVLGCRFRIKVPAPDSSREPTAG